MSLRHLGRRETRFELLVLIFSAMLINGEIAEARSTGAELFSLALRIDTSRLYTNNQRHSARGNNPRPDVKTRKR